jgi:hypothetical protein
LSKEYTMPAISVMARIETHMEDTQLIAFVGMLEHLLVAHFEHKSPIFAEASKGDADLAHDMRNGVCSAHVAARRAMRERNLTA